MLLRNDLCLMYAVFSRNRTISIHAVWIYPCANGMEFIPDSASIILSVNHAYYLVAAIPFIV